MSLMKYHLWTVIFSLFTVTLTFYSCTLSSQERSTAEIKVQEPVKLDRTQNDPSLRVDVTTEGIDPIKIPDPSRKYLQEDEEAIKEKASMYSVAAEIFSSSLKK